MERKKECPWAPKTKKFISQRQYDGSWTWPRELSFVTKEDLDMIPNDIKKQIYSYLRKTIAW